MHLIWNPKSWFEYFNTIKNSELMEQTRHKVLLKFHYHQYGRKCTLPPSLYPILPVQLSFFGTGYRLLYTIHSGKSEHTNAKRFPWLRLTCSKLAASAACEPEAKITFYRQTRKKQGTRKMAKEKEKQGVRARTWTWKRCKHGEQQRASTVGTATSTNRRQGCCRVLLPE